MPPILSSLSAAGLGALAKSAASDLASTLASLGKTDLAAAAPALTQFAADAAGWEIQRLQALASGNTAAVDQFNRDFGIFAALCAEQLADAGVQAQAASEAELMSVLQMLGKAVLAAAIAAI